MASFNFSGGSIVGGQVDPGDGRGPLTCRCGSTHGWRDVVMNTDHRGTHTSATCNACGTNVTRKPQR